jgi:amino acid transporter
MLEDPHRGEAERTDKVQIDHVWSKPTLLFPYMYSFMFVVLSGSQANALSFGKAVIIANTEEGTRIDDRLQKVFAIVIIGIVCLLQAYSRVNYVRFNNLFALYKIVLLTFLTITGWCAIAGKRAASAEAVGKPYGIGNLRSKDFIEADNNAYGYALALLSIMRVFLGYENANFVSAASPYFALTCNMTMLMAHSRSLRKFGDLQATSLASTGGLPNSPCSE